MNDVKTFKHSATKHSVNTSTTITVLFYLFNCLLPIILLKDKLDMYKVKSVNQIISNKNIIRLLSDSNKKVKENVVQVKDMSIHGICLASMKEAFTNFRSYITKSDSVKLALGRWHVEKVSKHWEKKRRYY